MIATTPSAQPMTQERNVQLLQMIILIAHQKVMTKATPSLQHVLTNMKAVKCGVMKENATLIPTVSVLHIMMCAASLIQLTPLTHAYL